MQVIGDVKGKDVVLVDDIIDTAGTLKLASEIIMDMGANSVRAMCTHGVLSGNAYKNIKDSALDEVLLTDTIPLKNTSCDKIRVLSTADLFADVINRIANFQSISEHFEFTTIL